MYRHIANISAYSLKCTNSLRPRLAFCPTLASHSHINNELKIVWIDLMRRLKQRVNEFRVFLKHRWWSTGLDFTFSAQWKKVDRPTLRALLTENKMIFLLDFYSIWNLLAVLASISLLFGAPFTSNSRHSNKIKNKDREKKKKMLVFAAKFRDVATSSISRCRVFIYFEHRNDQWKPFVWFCFPFGCFWQLQT